VNVLIGFISILISLTYENRKIVSNRKVSLKRWILQFFSILNTFIVVYAHFPFSSRYGIFCFSSSKPFQTGCHSLASFSPSVVSSPKQAAIVFITLVRSLPLIVYLKHLFPINKQFSIDSFLDWEGLHWDFSSMQLFRLPPLFRNSSIPTPEHWKRYFQAVASLDQDPSLPPPTLEEDENKVISIVCIGDS